jgi:acyl-CoA oxidase
MIFPDLLTALDWAVAWLLQQTANRVETLRQQKLSPFEVRNNSQAFYANNLAIVYAQRKIFEVFFKFVARQPNSAEKAALTRLLSLYGANLVTKHAGIFYQGGFLQGAATGELYQTAILNLLTELKNDSIALVDAIAPPDHVLNSALGKSDGEIYKNIESAIFQSANVLERPAWWRDFVYHETYAPPAKL